MNRRRLTISLALTITVALVLLILVITRVSETRQQVDAYEPGALNYLLQADHNFDRFTSTLSDYRFFRSDGERAAALKKQYLREFDLVWSLFTVFELPAQMVGGGQAEINRLIGKFSQYLADAEPKMLPDYDLDVEEIEHLLLAGRDLSRQLHKVGHQWFLHSTQSKDAWSGELAELDWYIGLFSLLLALALGVLSALLYRHHRHADLLLAEASDTRQQLEDTVEQLRSGRVERQAKDSFLAAASHDLRQPLHALGLYLGTLERHVSDAHGKGMLEEARHCASVLNRLFSSLLDISRLEAGSVAVAPEHVALEQLLDVIGREMSVSARDRGIDLSIDTSDGYVYTDPLLLGRILRNLLDNALKHSGASRIELTVRRQGNSYRLSVIDNGRGLPFAGDDSALSEEFQRWNPLRDRSKGLGLGLSIVKRLADLMTLPLSVETANGIGTRFHLDVPQGQALGSRAEMPDRLPVRPALRIDRVVAIVDDDVNVQLGMSAILESLGIVPVAAESANELIITLRRTGQVPDILLVDYQLEQDSDGTEAIRKVRGAVGMDIPALIVTGVSSAQIDDAAAQGGYRLLHKPVEPDVLIEAITDMLAPEAAPSTGGQSGQVVEFPRRRR